MIFKNIKQILQNIKSLDSKLDELRSLTIERSEFNRLYKRVNQIYFSNRDTQLVSFNQDPPVSMSDIMQRIMADNDLTKIITTTYVALSVLLKYSKSSVQEKELNEAMTTLLLNRERFRLNYLNGYNTIFILSNINIDALRVVSAIFKPIEEFDKFAIISNPSDIGSIAKRYPTLFISSTELSIFTVGGKEVTITEHPSFIMASMMYLMSEYDDFNSLIFLS